ncbi:MAG: hypothetical protein ACK5RL_07425 [Acidimicrobiales bacterium]
MTTTTGPKSTDRGHRAAVSPGSPTAPGPTPRTRSRARRGFAAASVAVTFLFAAGCGTAATAAAPTADEGDALGTDTGGGLPTLKSAPLSSEELSELGLTTASDTDDEASPVLPVGAPLGDGAPADEVRTVLESMHGPIDDLSGQMNRLVPFPSVTTPVGTYLTGVRVDARLTEDEQAVDVVAEATFAADGRPEDIIDGFAADFDGNGWDQTTRHGRSTDTWGVSHVLGYRVPGSGYPLENMVVAVTDQRPGPDGQARSDVVVRWVDQHPLAGDTTLGRLSAWAGTVPLPPGGSITGAGFQSSSVGRHSVHLMMSRRYDAATPGGVADGVRATAAGNGVSVVDTPRFGDKLDDWVYLSVPPLAETWVSPHALAGDRTVAVVDARMPFAPAGIASGGN